MAAQSNGRPGTYPGNKTDRFMISGKSIQHIIMSMLCCLVLVGCSINRKLEKTPAYDYLGQSLPGDEPEIFGPGLISLEGRFEMGFTMSQDGKYMAYGIYHETDTNQRKINFLVREANGWTEPKVPLLIRNANTFFPMFGPEGQVLEFSRAIPGADTDLYTTNFKVVKTITGYPLGGAINSEYREAGFGMSTDGFILFTSNRDQAQACCGDVYQAVLRDNFYEVDKVESLSSIWDEESLYLSPKGDYVIIQAWKPEYNGKHDLYISYRTISDGWTVPQRLNKQINSPEIEQRPFVSHDQQFLFFSRMKITQNGDEMLFDSDIYWTSTDKVFGPFIYNPVNSFEVENKQFELSIPKDIFGHVSEGILVPEITLVDGSPLPQGFLFDSATGILRGTMTEKRMTIRLTATDQNGQSISFEAELISKN